MISEAMHRVAVAHIPVSASVTAAARGRKTMLNTLPCVRGWRAMGGTFSSSGHWFFFSVTLPTAVMCVCVCGGEGDRRVCEKSVVWREPVKVER